MMKVIQITIIAFSAVGLSMLLGASEGGSLFGATLSVGYYLSYLIHKNKEE